MTVNLKNAVKRNSFVIIIPFVVLLMCLLSKRLYHLSYFDNISGVTFNYIRAFIGSYGLITDIAICYVLLVSIYFENNIWFWLLNSKLCLNLGILSYSIYIWQELFFSPKILPLSKFPINILCIYVVANLSFYFVEKPFLKLKIKFFKSQSRSPVRVP
jgi:peptidoglycan/LPS O-acetylase OafA/YrhL